MGVIGTQYPVFILAAKWRPRADMAFAILSMDSLMRLVTADRARQRFSSGLFVNPGNRVIGLLISGWMPFAMNWRIYLEMH